MVQKIGLEAFLELGGFNRQVKQYQQYITKMTDAAEGAGINTEKIGKAMDTLLPIVGGIGLAVGGATAAFYGLKKAMEFGKEGATIAQTQQSFDRLMASMGVAPDILGQMQDATNDTVDNMTLMSSTMTLLAGTSDELGNAMVKNAPELLRIAKAANKLNPALGTTAQLYEQLAYGIKRSSPQRIDDLGITIKLGEANEKMADKLGKTVEAMSAEEKQMAILEATLEGGRRMIEQVGGTTDAMGDSFIQTEIAIKNMTDQIKADTYPMLNDLFEIIADIAQATSTAYGTYKQLYALVAAAKEAKLALFTLKDPTEAFNRSMKDQLGITEEVRWEFDRLTGGIDAFSEAMDPYQEMMRGAAGATEELGVAQYEATITTDDLAKAQKALDDVIKDIRKSYEDFFGSLSQGIVKYRQLGDAQSQSAKDYAKTIASLNQDAKKAYDDVQKSFKASLPDPTTVQDRMGMAGDAWDEWGLRIQAIIDGGVSDPWYAALQEMGYSKPPDVGLVEWLEGLKEKFYAGQLPDLLPPEWAAKVKAQQEEATAAVQAESAKRRAAAKAERDAQLAEEKAARERSLIELSLNLAEQTNQLEAWSRQRFGEDMFGIADTAKEVLGLLDSGLLDIDSTLEEIIGRNADGLQEALDTTGEQAEKTKELYAGILDADWVEERRGTMATLGQVIEDEISDEPFTPMLNNFEGASQSIVTGAVTMGLELGKEFTDIDLDWAAMVQSQVESWDDGMGKVNKAIQEKVIEKLEEIPTKIVVTVTTEQEGGGTEGKQHGGPVQGGVPYVVGEAGPELFVPATRGTIIPNMALGMNLPALTGAGGGGSTLGPTVEITMNPTINNGMDLAEFQALTLTTVQQAIRGT